MSTLRKKSVAKARPRRSPGRPRQGDVAAIEKTILSVALQEFLNHGYGNASLTRIVKAAGISKTTLYSRYASKADLFSAIVQQQINTMAPESLLQDEAGGQSLEQGLKSYANHVLEVSLKGDMLEVNRLMYSESSRFPELARAAADRTNRGINRIAEFIAACAEADGVSCESPRVAAEVFILMIRGWYFDLMLTKQKITPAQRRQWVDKALNILLFSREHW